MSWANWWATIVRQATYLPRDSRSVSLVQDKLLLPVDTINLIFPYFPMENPHLPPFVGKVPWQSPQQQCHLENHQSAISMVPTPFDKCFLIKWELFPKQMGEYNKTCLKPLLVLLLYWLLLCFPIHNNSNPEKSETLLDKILHQLIWRIALSIPWVRCFTHPKCCRISSINCSGCLFGSWSTGCAGISCLLQTL